jgi:hypothetical protein
LIAASLIAAPAIAQTKIDISTGVYVVVHTQSFTVHDSQGERVPRARLDLVGGHTGPDLQAQVVVFGCARGAGEIAVVPDGNQATPKSMYAWARGNTKIFSLVAGVLCDKIGRLGA